MVKIGQQIYRQVHLSHVLQCHLFGLCFEKVKKDVRHRTPGRIEMHIHSMDRFKNLFTVNQLCASCYWRENFLLTCAGKLQIKYINIK